MPRFTHRKVIPIGATARVVAQRTPETLTLVRHRTQSTAETIARLSVTAVFAYLVALPLPLPGTAQPILAPLTALLVVQAALSCRDSGFVQTGRCAGRCPQPG
jgi:hypothetical protein